MLVQLSYPLDSRIYPPVKPVDRSLEGLILPKVRRLLDRSSYPPVNECQALDTRGYSLEPSPNARKD